MVSLKKRNQHFDELKKKDKELRRQKREINRVI
jgi:hypothetical protein